MYIVIGRLYKVRERYYCFPEVSISLSLSLFPFFFFDFDFLCYFDLQTNLTYYPFTERVGLAPWCYRIRNVARRMLLDECYSHALPRARSPWQQLLLPQTPRARCSWQQLLLPQTP